MKSIRFIALISAAAMCFGLCACGKSEKKDEIAVPILETKDITYNYPYSETVTFKASGQIKSIDVESPCDVKKGDLLCTLYSDDVDEQIEEEEIRLNQAKQTVATLQANGADYSEIQLSQYDLQIEQLKYDSLVASLEDYKVYAPCDGQFDLADRQGQELTAFMPVNKGEVLGYTSDKSQKALCVSVFDNALTNVNFGTAVQIVQGANTMGGTVTDIIYNESGDFSAYVYVITPDEENDMLDLGGIEVVFDVYSRLDTVIVPQKAVKKLDGRNYVNLLVDGVKIEQDVELGIEDNDNVEVLFGTGIGTVLSPVAAAALLTFSLLYTPCVAAIAAIKRELGMKWAVGVVIWQCAIAWAAALIVKLVVGIFV